MKVAVAREKSEPLSLEDWPMPEPGPGEVLVKAHACGVCHSDLFVVDAVSLTLRALMDVFQARVKR